MKLLIYDLVKYKPDQFWNENKNLWMKKIIYKWKLRNPDMVNQGGL
jgi:hypothetical protein